jgi:hypothetical protein
MTGYPAWTRTGPKVPSGLGAFLQRFGKSDKASFAEPDYAGPGDARFNPSMGSEFRVQGSESSF